MIPAARPGGRLEVAVGVQHHVRVRERQSASQVERGPDPSMLDAGGRLSSEFSRWQRVAADRADAREKANRPGEEPGRGIAAKQPGKGPNGCDGLGEASGHEWAWRPCRRLLTHGSYPLPQQ